MLNKNIVFEGRIDNEYDGSVILYFIVPKELLAISSQYPEAISMELSLEFPSNQIEARNADVCISPTNTDGEDYDWTDIELPEDEIDELIGMAMAKEKRKEENMKMTIITIRDYSNVTSFAVMTAKDANVEELFGKVKTWVKENISEPCRLSNVPNDALERFGIKRIKTDEITFCNDETLVKTNAEKAGVYFATCRACDAFDGGCCLKYGGECNPNDTADNCFHGNENAVRLSYDGETFGAIIIVENENLTPMDVISLAEINLKDYGIENPDEQLFKFEPLS